MVWQECKKMWKRPVILVSIVIVCALQFAQIWQNGEPPCAAERESYQKYSGVMDESWKKWIREEWERGGREDDVLGWAYMCTDFQDMVRGSVDNLKQRIAAKDPGYDLERVDRAYEGLVQADGLYFAPQTAFKKFISNLVYVKYCLILFLILQFAPVFAGETELGMGQMLAVCKYGRKKLFLSKFFACQISSLLIWTFTNLSAALAVGLRVGWVGLDGFVQDFFTNISPFVWNQRTYLTVVGIMGLAACQAVSALMFVVAYWSGTSVRSAVAAFVILFLPVVSVRLFPVARLLLPNFLAGDYLWSCFTEWRAGPWYIEEWKIAVVETVAILIVVWIWCMRHSYRIRE